MVVWEPARPDWEGIENGLVSQFELTATNYGLIRAENATLKWPRFWNNVEFLLPESLNRNGPDESYDLELGDIEANSSISVPVEVVRNTFIEVPADRYLERVGRGGILWLFNDDPRWVSEPGPSFIVIPHDETDNRIFVQQNLDSTIRSIYYFSNRTLITPLYNLDGDMVDAIETLNVDPPDDSSRRSLVVSENTATSQHRQLCIDNKQAMCWGLGVGIGLAKKLPWFVGPIVSFACSPSLCGFLNIFAEKFGPVVGYFATLACNVADGKLINFLLQTKVQSAFVILISYS